MVYLFILILAFATYTYVVAYTPLKKDKDSLNFEIALLESKIEQYEKVSSDEVLDTEDSEIDEEELIDFSTYLVELREQDQIRFFISIDDLSYAQVSGLNMTSAREMGSTGEYKVWANTMSFQYVVDSYDEFEEFFTYLSNHSNYPSSINTFSMNVNGDGSVSGTMNLENYHVTATGLERAYKIDSGVIIGGIRLFENQ